MSVTRKPRPQLVDVRHGVEAARRPADSAAQECSGTCPTPSRANARNREAFTMQKTKPIQSAFTPMRPSQTAMEAALAAAEVNPPQTAPASLPAKVEFWCEVVSRGDREVYGWSYFSGRGQDRRAIATTLNLNQPIVQRALSWVTNH